MVDENELLTPEAADKYRDEFAAELEAEESGVPVVDASSSAAEPEPEPKPEPEPEPEDPWAGVNPALKTEFEKLTTGNAAVITALNASETRLKQTESRIGAITNLLNAAKQEAADAKAAPTQEQIAEAAKSTESFEQLKKDFPEIGDAVDKEMDARFKKFELTRTPEQPGLDSEEARKLIAEEIDKGTKETDEQEVDTLIEAYPDYFTTIASEPYEKWLSGQSPAVKARTKSNRAIDAISVLDDYVKDTPPEKTAAQILEERQQRLKTSELPVGKSAPSPKTDDELSDEEYRDKIGEEIFAEP